MNKNEFIQTAVSGGYCSRQTAEQYAEAKDSFDTDDYIAVYRQFSGIQSISANGKLWDAINQSNQKAKIKRKGI